jgi:hypothetical protein
MEQGVPLFLTLTREEQFTLYLRARELHEMVTDPTLGVEEMQAVRNDFMRAAKTLAQHGFNFWRSR